MRLFIRNRIDNQKIYIDKLARTRQALRLQFNGDLFTCKNYKYSVREVWAEAEFIKIAVPTLLGSMLGAIAGPIGLMASATVAGVSGRNAALNENKRVASFNNSD